MDREHFGRRPAFGTGGSQPRCAPGAGSPESWAAGDPLQPVSQPSWGEPGQVICKSFTRDPLAPVANKVPF